MTDAVGALPDAVDPLALSLNENPFPPLPVVRSALIESIDAANRYPEYLPERLRSLIAEHVGVRDEQVVIGEGATGVILQVLHAVTSPGESMVMTSPTFDGYPIFAQMARLRSVTVPLDQHGHHDLDAMAEAASQARVVVVCRPHNPTGTVEAADDIERFLQRVPQDTVVLLDEAYVEFLSPDYRIDAPALVERYPECRSAADLLEGVRSGRPADRLRVLCVRTRAQAVDHAAALRNRHHQLRSRGGVLRRRKPTPATYSNDCLRAAFPAHAAPRDGCLHHRRACQLRVPAGTWSAVARAYSTAPD